jgi:hypothetical protein
MHQGPNIAAVLLATLLLAPVIAGADERARNHDGYTGWAVPTEPVLPGREVHPSLWFRAGDVDALRARATADEFARRLMQEIRASRYVSDPLPEAPPPIEADKETWHKYWGDIPQFAAYNGFLSWIEEDESARERYRSRAIEALLRAFDGDLYRIDPRGKGSAADEIYRGVWLQNFATAYDLVQPWLGAEEDAAIRERLAQEAGYLSSILFELAESPHNHLSKPAWGVGSMALALSEHPEAAQWLENALRASNANTRFYFSEDGVYREGSHYYIFSLINFVPFLYHYRNVSGMDLFPIFQPAFEAPIAMRTARGWMPNIEDSYLRPFPSFMVQGAYRGRHTYLRPEGDLAQVLAWNWANTDMATFDDSERETGFNYSGASWDYAKPLFEFLTYDPDIAPAAPTHSPTIFLDSGVSIFRNAWDLPPAEQRWLLFQGIAEADNHQHFDHLSFILAAKGQLMASDSGYSRSSYGEEIRTTWYRTARAHNVVTANGEAPVDHSESIPPTMKYRLDTDFFDFEEKTAIYAAGGQHRRAIAFPGEEYFIVVDDVELPEPREVNVLFHGGRSKVAGEGNTRVWTYSDDRYGSAARLHSIHIGGDQSRLTDHEGEVTYIKGDYELFPYVALEQHTAAGAFLQIFVPTAIEEDAPQWVDLSAGQVRAARVTHHDSEDLVLSQRERRTVVLAGMETDGTFAFVRKGSDGFVAAREATYLRIPQEGLAWTFDAPTTFAASLGAGALHYASNPSPGRMGGDE